MENAPHFLKASEEVDTLLPMKTYNQQPHKHTQVPAGLENILSHWLYSHSIHLALLPKNQLG